MCAAGKCHLYLFVLTQLPFGTQLQNFISISFILPHLVHCSKPLKMLMIPIYLLNVNLDIWYQVLIYNLRYSTQVISVHKPVRGFVGPCSSSFRRTEKSECPPPYTSCFLSHFNSKLSICQSGIFGGDIFWSLSRH